MRAEKISVGGREREQELRGRARGGLFADTQLPGLAYACGNCGNILLFAPSEDTLDGQQVHCSSCGAANAIVA
jgi:DNA-directed RNA polymerase subunit RPC12/RpoP